MNGRGPWQPSELGSWGTRLGLGLCLIFGRESCRSRLVRWTLRTVNSPIYFSRPECCPQGRLTPSSSRLQDSVCRTGVTGVQHLTSGDPGRSLCAPRVTARVAGRGRQGRLSLRAALLLLFFSRLMQSEQKPGRARSPVLLCGLKLPSPPSGEAFLNNENKVKR